MRGEGRKERMKKKEEANQAQQLTRKCFRECSGHTDRMSTKQPRNSLETVKKALRENKHMRHWSNYHIDINRHFFFCLVCYAICVCVYCTQTGSGAGTLNDGVFAGIVQDRTLGKGDICCDPCDGYSAIHNSQ